MIYKTEGQVPEALRLAEQYDHGDPAAHGNAWKAAVCAELRRLHAYCQELEAQVILDCMTHAQNPSEIEHVAGDVSKNGAESNMTPQPVAQQGAAYAPRVYLSVNQLLQAIEFATGGAPASADDLETSIGFQIGDSQDDDGKVIHGMRCWLADYPDEGVYPLDEEPTAKDLEAHALRTQQPAPATQQAGVALSEDLRDRLVAISEAVADQDDRAAQAMLREILKAPQADSQPAPVQSGLVATMLDALRHAQKVLNHNNLHLECGPVNAAILAARDPADSVLEDAARYRWLRRWKGQEHEPPFTVQHEIDGTLWGGDLDAAIDAASKQGANHDNP